MSSEEMRTELEKFVNTGLREGWTGWPLKVEACTEGRSVREWSVAPARAWRRSRDRRSRPTRLEMVMTSLHSLC